MLFNDHLLLVFTIKQGHKKIFCFEKTNLGQSLAIVYIVDGDRANNLSPKGDRYYCES